MQRGNCIAAMVDTERLLLPHPGESPCGEVLDYDVDFLKLEIVARGRSEQQMGYAISAGEEPDWRTVENMTLALCERSKDLRVGVLLARARLHNDGFIGFEEALRLLGGYVDRFWDAVHPMPEPDEGHTIRVNALADPVDLLGDVRRTPLASSAVLGPVSLRDVQIANRRLAAGADTPVINLADIEARFLATQPDQLAATAAALSGCIEAVDVMARVMTACAPSDLGSPLDALGEALRDARAEFEPYLATPEPQAAPAEGEASAEDASVEVAGSLRVFAASGEIHVRADIEITLERICRWYATNEPASPVPDLLERAKRLVSQNFLALLLELAPAGAEQFRHLAGIRDRQD
jgi:type VI secretion system protein ImpA